MGGDNAPVETVKGAVEAVNESGKIKVYLVGKQDVLEKELAGYTYPKEQIEVVHASEIIETAEPPVMAIRKKKDSSLVKALNLVKDGTCDAYVSAGAGFVVVLTGAIMTMPGLPKKPAADNIDVNEEGAITGLF